jgi:hypothetical protein
VTGFILDSISELTKPLIPAGPEQGDSGEDILNWILEATRWAARLEEQSNRRIDMTAFWTTAIAGFYLKGWGQVDRSDTYPEFDQQIEVFNKSVNELRKYLGNNGKFQDLANSQGDIFPTVQDPENSLAGLSQRLAPLLGLIGSAAQGRCLAYTNDGNNSMMALVVGDAQAGDILSIFHTTPLPFILRKEQEKFRLVGTCYIHGMMNGEAFESGRWEAQRIVLC